MNIADIIKVVDTSPLNAYPWGSDVVNTVNAYLDTDKHLTLGDNGEALIDSIYALPSSIRSHLLKHEIVRTSNKNEAKTQQEIHPILKHEEKEEVSVGYLLQYRPIVTTILGLAVVFIAGIMAVHVSIKADHAHAMPPRPTNVIIRYASDLLRTLSHDMDTSGNYPNAPQSNDSSHPTSGSTSPQRSAPRASSSVSAPSKPA